VPQITDIKPQKRKQRFNVYVDERFAFAVSAEALAKAGLKTNQEIPEEKIEELTKEDDFVKIYERVLKFFSFRPRSEKELRDWFRKKQIGEETQKLIYQKLRNLGYLDDEEFAKWWIEQRTTFRPSGLRLLTLELRQKGISKDLIAKLLNCHIVKDKEVELARKVAGKKLKLLKHLSDLELRQKLTAALIRRGFSFEVAKKVVDEIKSSSL